MPGESCRDTAARSQAGGAGKTWWNQVIMLSCAAGQLCRPRGRAGCASVSWLLVKLPFMILRVVPHLGDILRREAAAQAGVRAQASAEELGPADDAAAVAAALAGIRAHDAGFELAATARGAGRAREVVDRARQPGDASAARRSCRMACGGSSSCSWRRTARAHRRSDAAGSAWPADMARGLGHPPVSSGDDPRERRYPGRPVP